MLTAGVAIGIVIAYLILPRLNTFTGGQLAQRLADTGTTNRTEIALTDLQMFVAHPLFGVGPGMGFFERSTTFLGSDAAHTEFTRLLAEHGIPGLVALALLLAMAWRSIRDAGTYWARGWTLVLIGWSITEMGHASMRIAAISFLFGLAACRWDDEADPSEAARGHA